MTNKAVRRGAGILLLLVIGGALSSCAQMNMKWAQPQRILERDRADRIQSTRIRNTLAAPVIVPIRPSINSDGADLANAMLPGFGVLILAHEAAKANEVWSFTLAKVRPLQEHTKNIDFNRMLGEQLISRIPAIQWLNVKKVENVVRAPVNQLRAINQIRNEVQTGQENAVLEIQTDYWLSPHLSTLCVGSKVRIWVKSEKNTPIYIGTFLYQSLPVVEDGEAENLAAVEKIADQAMERWMAFNQAAYRYAIAQGVREISAMVLYELNERAGVAHAGEEKISLRYTSAGSIGRADVKGRVIHKSGNRYWIRANRIMMSLAKDGILMGDVGSRGHLAFDERRSIDRSEDIRVSDLAFRYSGSRIPN